MSLLRFLMSGAGPLATQTIAVTDANVFFSPYNTYSDGAGAMAATNVKSSSTYALKVNTGAYLKFKLTVAGGGAGNVSILLDTTAYNGLTANTCPTISYSYDKRPFTNALLAYSAADVTQALFTGIAAGTHDVEIRFKSVGGAALGSTADRWTTPKYAVKVKGIAIDATASVPSQTTRTYRAIFFGDSHSEGDNVLLAEGDSGNDLANASNDAFRTWAAFVAAGMNAEYGLVAYGGQGVDKGIGFTTASSTNPSLYNSTAANQSWDKYFASTARDITSPVTPDFIFIKSGYNDSGLSAANVTSLVDAIRTAVGSTPWIFWVSGTGSNEANIATGVAAAASPAKTKYISITDLVTEGTASEYSGDASLGSSHPNVLGQALAAAEVIKSAQAYISAANTVGLEPVGTAMHKGEVETASTVYGTFRTRAPSTGAPITLAGTPALSVYKNNSTTQSTTGVTLTVDFDSVTGLHHYAIDTSADATFYSPGSSFEIVITTGTVDGVSAVGTPVGSFTLRNSTLRGTVGTGSTTTSIVTSAMSPATGTADQIKDRVVVFDGNTTTAALRGQVAQISASSASATPTLTVSTMVASPASGDKFTVV